MTLMAESATQRVDVVGMENHTCSDLPVATAAAAVTRLGKAPLIGLLINVPGTLDNSHEQVWHNV